MSGELLYDGFHKIEAVEAEIKGNTVKREKLTLPSAVSALVTDQDGDMVLVYQYRPTIGRHTWEIPAGVLDKGHLSPHATMLEELKEECDINPDEIIEGRGAIYPIHRYFMVTGSSDATMEMFRIKCHSRELEYEVQDSEVEKVQWFDRKQIHRMFLDKEFIDPKTIIAVQTYLLEEF